MTSPAVVFVQGLMRINLQEEQVEFGCLKNIAAIDQRISYSWSYLQHANVCKNATSTRSKVKYLKRYVGSMRDTIHHCT